MVDLRFTNVFGIQRGDDWHQNRGDDHAGGDKRGSGSGNRFKRRVNLSDDYRVSNRRAGGRRGRNTRRTVTAADEFVGQNQRDTGDNDDRQTQDDTRLMFQDARLLPWKKVIDNVGLGLQGNWRQDALNALAAVGLENRAAEWPAALSGGQKQRVALARALIHRPRLLLLDEPLGALDALTRLEMQALIESLWLEHGFTVLLVTHDVSEAVALADRVLLIEDGRIGLDLTVDIARPRRHGSVRLAELEAEVLDRVMRKAPQPVREVKAG